jgi:type IV pilus assembly protein PilW
MNHAVMRSRQRGLSLIELMVAMVIGLFLILGVTQIFISNQRSYLFQQGQVGNQENGRFTLALLSQELLKAGYRSNLGIGILADNTTLANCSFKEGNSVAAVSATSLCIQYQATGKRDVNCQGTALAAADQDNIIAPYSVKSENAATRPKTVERIAFDSNTNSITCTNGTTTQQLVTGVRDLRFEYGTGTTEKTVSTFSTNPDANATIGAVRYSALMQSQGTAAIRDSTAQVSPALADWNTRYGTTYNDVSSIYQIVQGTITVRNQMP